MLLSNDPQGLRRLTMVAIFASLAVVLGIVESMIPFAVAIPGAKLGLGNIVVVVALLFFGGKDTIMLIVVKTLLTAFILGSFSTFLFSIMGALASFLVMLAMMKLGSGSFSLISISIVGGIFHNLGQLTAASWVLGTFKIYYYLPFLLVAGIATGLFVGVASGYLSTALTRHGLFHLASDKI
ncbi:Gx transporter family protein [Paenibacillus daejeonensis]|uniref:Gx transporter family protein n=1 Tax=Paenibacillus daejeonensis TaxID=135193 RepID=UPI000377E7A1|nr:Gx transporter family protein [Paenibacillus daejeonensis]